MSPFIKLGECMGVISGNMPLPMVHADDGVHAQPLRVRANDVLHSCTRLGGSDKVVVPKVLQAVVQAPFA